jgi:hypothetical protein
MAARRRRFEVKVMRSRLNQERAVNRCVYCARIITAQSTPQINMIIMAKTHVKLPRC